jgi:outer membrane receptor for ferrienterochelin and colicins
MRKIFLCIAALLLAAAINAQNTFKGVVKCGHHKEPLAGATIIIEKLNITVVADSTGKVVINNIPDGKYTIKITFVGRPDLEKEFTFPLPSNNVIDLFMEEEEHEEEEEVVIQSTRSTRTITDIPTRVEFVAGEELDEKANMKPGDIRMVLTESTGIMTQQTSATSANASIRIQGLDGRYTQILKDGFPMYAGFSSGLGLLQTPPLDLKQFEVIKGSASTLYGGGAIAGLVNLISKTPKDKRELSFHFDVTSGGGLNTSGFYGKKFGKTGLTVFASRNSNSAFDPADIGLTAIPKFERYTLNPKLFFYIGSKTNLNIGVNFTTEERLGGDMAYIKGNNPTGFFEKNETDRINTQLSFDHQFGNHEHIIVKNSIGHFRRVIHANSYIFAGDQTNSFTEITYAAHGDRTEWIGGVNLVTDKFEDEKFTATPLRSYSQLTFGSFVQNTWKVNEKVHIESGLRGDLVKDYGFVFLPRVSALFKFSPKLSSRVGGGLGYKAPNIFTEESERMQYKNVLPIDDAVNKLEKSYGVSADINYKTKLADGEIGFSINQLFFYTRINDPLLLQPDGSNFRFNNVNGHIDSRGLETNMKLSYKDFKLFLGYTFTDASLHQGNTKTESFLTPKHRLNSVLIYEVHEKIKIGLEGYYFDKQKLSDGATGKSYWVMGFMAEKLWEKFSLYINFENFLDARQTKFDTIYTGSISNPQFRDIYAPLDGFVINGGIKLRL